MSGSNNNGDMVSVPHQRGYTSGYVSYLGNLFSISILYIPRSMYTSLLDLEYYVNIKLNISSLIYHSYINFSDMHSVGVSFIASVTNAEIS